MNFGTSFWVGHTGIRGRTSRLIEYVLDGVHVPGIAPTTTT